MEGIKKVNRPLGQEERTRSLDRMSAEGVDVLIIGGGVTGCGVALDATARGYRVALVERDDFAAGTSSKSTKLVHGGIRYLQQRDFALVREALTERDMLTRNAPFLVRPIGFVLPVYANARRPLGIPLPLPFAGGVSLVLRAGLWIYDMLAGRRGAHRQRRIGAGHAMRMAPCLGHSGLRDAFLYYDAQTDDARLTTTILRTAALRGALVANYAEVHGFEQADGRIVRALVHDCLSGRELSVGVRHVINAGGVFATEIETMAGGQPHVHVEPARGVHLTAPRSSVNLRRCAVLLPETDDGRVLFLVPWGPRVIIGTTDTVGGDIHRPRAEPDDVDYLLRHVNRYLDCELTRSDIISAWAGYRPLVRTPHSPAASARLSRTHAVVPGNGGMLTIIGGKLTTYRRMAQDVMDALDKADGKQPCSSTQDLPLAGSDGWSSVRSALPALSRRYKLAPDQVQRLRSYGANLRVILDIVDAEPALAQRLTPDLPYIMAEVVYACRYEMAITLVDVLARRTRVIMEDWSHGRDCAPAVAACMATELGWDLQEIDRQLAAYDEAAASYEAPEMQA